MVELQDSPKAWVVTIGCFCSMMCTLGASTSFGVFQVYYINGPLSTKSASSIGWVGGIQYFLLFALGIPASTLQSYGYTRHLVWIGSSMMIIAELGLSWCRTYIQILFVQGILFGLGSGLLFAPSCTVVPPWFKRRRHTALGVLATGSAIGGAAFSAITATLLAKIGFAWTTRALSLCFACLLTVSSFLIEPFPDQVRLEEGGPTPRDTRFTLTAIKQPSFLVYIVGVCFAGAGVYLPVNYLEDYVARLHLPSEPGYLSYLVSISNAASITGRLLAGYLADRSSPLTVLVPVTSVCGILCLLWTRFDTAASTLGFTIAFGSIMGAYVALLPAGATQIRPFDVANSVGIMFTILSVPSLCSQPIFGALITDAAGSSAYKNASIFAGCVFLVSSLSLSAVWTMSRPVKVVDTLAHGP